MAPQSDLQEIGKDGFDLVEEMIRRKKQQGRSIKSDELARKIGEAVYIVDQKIGKEGFDLVEEMIRRKKQQGRSIKSDELARKMKEAVYIVDKNGQERVIYGCKPLVNGVV